MCVCVCTMPDARAEAAAARHVTWWSVMHNNVAEALVCESVRTECASGLPAASGSRLPRAF